jgi:hypothetical protein
LIENWIIKKLIDYISQIAKNFLLFKPSISLNIENYSISNASELNGIRIKILLGITNLGAVLNTIKKISYESLKENWAINVEKINTVNNLVYLEKHPSPLANISSDNIILCPLNIQPGETVMKYIFLKTDHIPLNGARIKISVVDSHDKTYKQILDVKAS